jgi:hypothetical protein
LFDERKRCKKGIADRGDLEMTKRKVSRDEYFSMMFPNFDAASSIRKLLLSSFFHTLTLGWTRVHFEEA